MHIKHKQEYNLNFLPSYFTVFMRVQVVYHIYYYIGLVCCSGMLRTWFLRFGLASQGGGGGGGGRWEQGLMLLLGLAGYITCALRMKVADLCIHIQPHCGLATGL